MTDVLQPSSERPMLIELAGEIDLANAGTLGECLCQAIDLTRSGLVVDMTAVSFLDSSGMAMMVRVQRAASRAELHGHLARRPARSGESARTHRTRPVPRLRGLRMAYLANPRG